MSTRDQRALFYDLVGTLRETKVFGFRGKYSCKAEILVAAPSVKQLAKMEWDFEGPYCAPPRGCSWETLSTASRE